MRCVSAFVVASLAFAPVPTAASDDDDDFIFCEAVFDNVWAFTNVFRGDYSDVTYIKRKVKRRAARRFGLQEWELKVLCFYENSEIAAQRERKRKLWNAESRDYLEARTFRFWP